MLTIEEIRQRLHDHRPEAVAAATGLAYRTVIRYRNGEVSEPPLSIVVLLSDYLTTHEVPGVDR
jgi:hypothetical protein